MNREEILKIAKPILFNTEMIQAILENRKTVTRRNPFKFEMKDGYNPDWSGYTLGEYYTGHIDSGVCLYSRGAHDVWGVRSNVVKFKYKVGDILYVRETWSLYECEKCRVGIPSLGGECKCEYVYRTNYGTTEDDSFPPSMFKWKPSIHMPKEAARIFLKITNVRVERLQDITEEQAVKEGCITFNDKIGNGKFDDVLEFDLTAKDAFVDLWNSTLKKDSACTWMHNPWVWVIEFERVKEDADEERPHKRLCDGSI